MVEHALKPGWTWVRLGDVAKQVKDKVDEPSACGITHYVPGGGIHADRLSITEWLPVNDGLMGPAFHMRFLPGQTLYKSRVPHGVAVADRIGICANTTYVLQAKQHRLLPDLLPYILTTQAFHQFEDQTNRGSTNLFLNFSDVSQYEFALPPLAEQRRIAGVLWAAESARNDHYQMLHAIRLLWRATAADYFSETGLALAGKQGVRLGTQLDYSSDGPFGSKLKTEHYSDTGVRVIRLQNIDQRSFNDEDRAYISEDYYQSTLTDYTVRPGDILIAGLGDERIQPGRACIVPSDVGLAVNKADCYCLRPKKTLDAQFLMCFLNSAPGLRQSASFAQGTTRYRLNLRNIRRFWVPLPSRTVQEEIAETLTEMQRAEDAALERLDGASAFLKGMLASLLGEEAHV